MDEVKIFYGGWTRLVQPAGSCLTALGDYEGHPGFFSEPSRGTLSREVEGEVLGDMGVRAPALIATLESFMVGVGIQRTSTVRAMRYHLSGRGYASGSLKPN